MTRASRDDPAFSLARRCLAAQRDVLRRDAKVRQTEQALALWARRVNLPLLVATRSSHPMARQLRNYERRAVRARRQRDRLAGQLSATPAADTRATRVKLSLAIALNPLIAEALTRSARHDLRTH